MFMGLSLQLYLGQGSVAVPKLLEQGQKRTGQDELLSFVRAWGQSLLIHSCHCEPQSWDHAPFIFSQESHAACPLASSCSRPHPRQPTCFPPGASCLLWAVQPGPLVALGRAGRTTFFNHDLCPHLARPREGSRRPPKAQTQPQGRLGSVWESAREASLSPPRGASSSVSAWIPFLPLSAG